jgi:hypothetical protein
MNQSYLVLEIETLTRMILQASGPEEGEVRL